MRTIKENLFHRLATQASEAELQGLNKIAEALTTQIEKQSTKLRKDDDSYSYSSEEFDKDITDQLWGVVIRTADFYGSSRIDAVKVQEIIEKLAHQMKSEMCNIIGIPHGVGNYEQKVPGESFERVDIEIEED